MYKAVSKNNIFKSYDILEIAEYVIENPNEEYIFFNSFELLQPIAFLKHFLMETKNYDKYCQLYTSLLKPLNIYEYVYENHYKQE